MKAITYNLPEQPKPDQGSSNFDIHIYKDHNNYGSSLNNLPGPKKHFKDKTEEWLVKKKKVPMTEDQSILDQFNCGYAGKIVVTGKLYVTNKRVCFYSPFNDKNLFFQSTFIQIPKEDILKIEKKYNAKIFDNSIEITKKNLETIFFTSFVSRNKCYDLMISHLIIPEIPLVKAPSQKKSQYEYDTQFLLSKVKLQEFEYLINSFSCGLATQINIMGRFYITNRRLFFYSMFNQEGKSLTGTEINIQAHQILRIQKRYNTLVFDNSILIITAKGSYFFTSFLARDKVFQILLDVFVHNSQVPTQSQQQDEDVFYDVLEFVDEEDFGKKIQKMNESSKPKFIEHQKDIFESKNQKINKIVTYDREIDDLKVNPSEFLRKVEQNDDIKQEQVDCREKQIIGIISHQNKLQKIGESILKFPGLNALKTLRIFDSGQQFFFNGQKFDNFMTFFKKQIMDRKNIKISKWKPNILEYLNTSNIKANAPLEFERDMNQVVKLEKTGIPFMPNEAKSREFQRLFLVSKDKYIVESYVQNQGAPYSDTFHINGRRTVQTIQQGTVKMTVWMETVFSKKPFLSSMIQSKCEQQGTKQQQKMFDAMKEYFKRLQESKIKK